MAQIRIDLRYKRIAQDQHQVEIVACSQVRGKHSHNPWLRTQAHIRLSLSLALPAAGPHALRFVWLGDGRVQGCGFEDKRELIEFHEVRDCPNKRAGCGDCGDLMPASRIRDHKQNDCPHRIVQCVCFEDGWKS